MIGSFPNKMQSILLVMYLIFLKKIYSFVYNESGGKPTDAVCVIDDKTQDCLVKRKLMLESRDEIY